MGAVQDFNGLNGAVVARKDINALIIDAGKDEQPMVAARLRKLLANNPKEKLFCLKINNPAVEQVPESFLHCLDCEQDKDDIIIGLGKAVSSNEIYQMITDRMIEMVKAANKKDYKQKWKAKDYGTGYLIPYNFVSKKMYRGVNRFLLTDFEPLENPFYLTFKQVEDLGGKVKKGAHGRMVVYFTQLFTHHDTKGKVNIASYDKKKFIELVEQNRDKIEALKNGGSPGQLAEQSALPILKYYKVFNGKDIEGIDFDLANFKHGYIERELPSTEENRIPVADSIIKYYPAPQPTLRHGGDRAFYSSGVDRVTMPHLADFETSQDYYRTLFHEFAHSTGHASRLKRKFGTRFGTKDYAFEELVAEFGATFLSAEAGIIWHNNNNHAAYLKSWNSALTYLNDDNRFLMRAATQAQKLADFVLQYDSKGQPAYFSDLKPIIKRPKKKKAVAKPVKKEAKPTVKVVKQEPIKNTVVAPKRRKRKIDETQLTLGLNKPKYKRGLNGIESVQEARPVETPIMVEQIVPQEIVREHKEIAPAVKKNCRVQKIGSDAGDEPSEFYTVQGEVGKFLQQVERKPFESVVITMDGEQGAGKTTTLYKFMQDFGAPGNKCLYISGEEHPSSSLAKDKAAKYLTPEAIQNIDTVAKVTDVADLYDLVKDYEIIFIDSWQKLQRMVGGIRLDEDLRQKFDGKVFVIIFQQTTTGRTKGGAEVVFDGDIIIKMVKQPSFADNYAYFDKNRYTLIPIEDIRYNIATGQTYNPNAKVEDSKPVAQLTHERPALLFKAV